MRDESRITRSPHSFWRAQLCPSTGVCAHPYARARNVYPPSPAPSPYLSSTASAHPSPVLPAPGRAPSGGYDYPPPISPTLGTFGPMDYGNMGAPPGQLSADMQVRREGGSVLTRANCDIVRECDEHGEGLQKQEGGGEVRTGRRGVIGQGECRQRSNMRVHTHILIITPLEIGGSTECRTRLSSTLRQEWLGCLLRPGAAPGSTVFARVSDHFHVSVRVRVRVHVRVRVRVRGVIAPCITNRLAYPDAN